jgi:hypothetical protein
MPVANRDASELTRARAAMALYGYANTLQAQQNAGTTVRREQNTVQLARIIPQRNMGGCYCSNETAGVYIFGGKGAPGSCGCATGN